MADELTERGLDLLRQSFGWARDGDAAHISELLDMGASPDLTNEHGDTLLILAAYHCQMDTVRLLLQTGGSCRPNERQRPDRIGRRCLPPGG
jgi:ankyrin repeat protein